MSYFDLHETSLISGTLWTITDLGGFAWMTSEATVAAGRPDQPLHRQMVSGKLLEAPHLYADHASIAYINRRSKGSDRAHLS